MSFNYYENTNFINNRNRKRTLILDIEDSASGATHLGSGGEFNIQLYEPLRIDKHSEIYLDNFLTFNSNISGGQTAAFVLKINEFNMNSNVASSHNASGNNPGGQHLFNSLIIPNEHKSPSNNHTAVVHKGKKFNYICDMNPQTISSLSGTITDLAGQPIFHGTHNTTGQFTYALTGIDEDLVPTDIDGGDEDFTNHPLQPTDTITGISIASETNPTLTVPGHILVNTTNSANTIHFSLADSIDVGKFHNGSGAIVFNISRPAGGTDGRPGEASTAAGTSGTITLANGSSTVNPNLQLIKGDGRFIAEFSIVSRE